MYSARRPDFRLLRTAETEVVVSCLNAGSIAVVRRALGLILKPGPAPGYLVLLAIVRVRRRVAGVGLEPVRRPLPHVAGHVHGPIGAGPGAKAAHRRRAAQAGGLDISFLGVPLIPPGESEPVSASRCLLPLGLGRQTPAQPLTLTTGWFSLPSE
jgi:hypothetical protein